MSVRVCECASVINILSDKKFFFCLLTALKVLAIAAIIKDNTTPGPRESQEEINDHKCVSMNNLHWYK